MEYKMFVPFETDTISKLHNSNEQPKPDARVMVEIDYLGRSHLFLGKKENEGWVCDFYGQLRLLPLNIVKGWYDVVPLLVDIISVENNSVLAAKDELVRFMFEDENGLMVETIKEPKVSFYAEPGEVEQIVDGAVND